MTQAEDQKKLLTEDRSAYLSEIELNLAGDAPRLRDFRTNRYAIQPGADPLEPYLNLLETWVREGFQELSGDVSATLDDVFVTLTSEEQAAAHIRRFDDGSSLIVMTEALLSMCTLLTHLNSFWQERQGPRIGPLRLTWKMVRHSMEPRPDPVIATSLRFYLVQQRVFGLPAMRMPDLSRRSAAEADLVATLSHCFVLAHEMAHRALHHLDGAGELHETSRELAADALAYRVVNNIARARFRRRDELAGGLSATIAMLSTRAAESTLFVRLGESHPPAEARRRAVITGGGALVQGLDGYLSGLLESLACALDFSSPLPADWWSDLFTAVPKVFAGSPVDGPIPVARMLDHSLTCDLRPAPRPRERRTGGRPAVRDRRGTGPAGQPPDGGCDRRPGRVHPAAGSDTPTSRVDLPRPDPRVR